MPLSVNPWRHSNCVSLLSATDSDYLYCVWSSGLIIARKCYPSCVSSTF